MIIKRYLLVASLLAPFCSASDLVSSYYMENEAYITDLLVRCVAKHVQEKTNTINQRTNLPVNQLDQVAITSFFAYPYISVEFGASKSMIHRLTAMNCVFDRINGDILSITSYNWNAPEEDISNYAPRVDVAERYLKYDGEDLDLEDLFFGIKLDYDAVLQMLKKVNQLADSGIPTN